MLKDYCAILEVNGSLEGIIEVVERADKIIREEEEREGRERV